MRGGGARVKVLDRWQKDQWGRGLGFLLKLSLTS